MYFFNLKPNLTGQPTFLSNFLAEAQCKAIIDSCEANARGGIEDGKVHDDVRQSEISWLAPEGEHRWLFDKVKDCMNAVTSDSFRYDLIGFEGIQFTKYRYVAGRSDFYSSHVDTLLSDGTVRKLSFTIQLSGSETYDSGDVMLYRSLIDSMALSRAIGSISFFPSYTIHEVHPVTRGVRYSLVGWGRGPAFS